MTGIQPSVLTAEHLDIIKRLKALMIDRSLPLWACKGWDSSRGGFVERLDISGTLDDAAPRRVRVQARQIYCFAKAAELGWFPEGRELAMKGLAYLLSKAKGPDGRPGYVHLLDADGAVLDPLRDTYDQAFVLLALAIAYKLKRDRSAYGISRHRSAIASRRFPRGHSGDVAAPAESAHASVRGDDRNVRGHR